MTKAKNMFEKRLEVGKIMMRDSKGRFIKDYIPWIKGRKHTLKSKIKMSETRNQRIKEGKIIIPKGKHFNPKTEFKKGHRVSKETREKLRKANLGKKLSKEHRKKMIKNHPKYWLGKKRSKETIRKILIRRVPSGLEKKMIGIIQKYNLPYKFVGNGKFFIERKNPDFINCNGEKIAIEVYYRKHKTLFGQAKGIGIEKWKEDRSEIFAKYGWELLFFDETQVNEENIKRCLS